MRKLCQYLKRPLVSILIIWAYYLILALLIKNFNRLPEASQAFEKAANLNPQSFSSNKELGELLAKEGDFERAADYYRRAVKLTRLILMAIIIWEFVWSIWGMERRPWLNFKRRLSSSQTMLKLIFSLVHFISVRIKPRKLSEPGKFLQLAPQSDKAPLARQLLDFLKNKKSKYLKPGLN